MYICMHYVQHNTGTNIAVASEIRNEKPGFEGEGGTCCF